MQNSETESNTTFKDLYVNLYMVFYIFITHPYFIIFMTFDSQEETFYIYSVDPSPQKYTLNWKTNRKMAIKLVDIPEQFFRKADGKKFSKVVRISLHVAFSLWICI